MGPVVIGLVEKVGIRLVTGDAIRVTFDGGFSGASGKVIVGVLAEGSPNFEILTEIPVVSISGTFDLDGTFPNEANYLPLPAWISDKAVQ